MLPKIIVITGVDGSGKTTQTRLLTESLESEGKTARQVDQFASGFVLRIFIALFGDRLKSLERSTSSKQEISESASRAGWLTKALRFLAMARIVLTGLSHSWTRILANRRAEYLIFDRYFCDVLIKLDWMYEVRHDQLLFLNRLVPTPEVLVYLNVDSDIAVERETDGDVTREQLQSKNGCYQAYFSGDVGNLDHVEIDANKDKQAVHADIVEAVSKTSK